MEKIKIRKTKPEEKELLVQWLSDPETLQWFPMINRQEIEDAARIWISYIQYGAVLTALYQGIPCGVANLYLQPFKKLAHQCLFAIVVDKDYRGKGVGTVLLTELMRLGKETFHLKYLHLEVYENNPAVSLYTKLGFKKFGVQPHFIKTKEHTYLGKLLMQKEL